MYQFDHPFWRNVAIGASAECWPWKRSKMPAGYGKAWFRGKAEYAHRVAFALAKNGGVMPEGQVLHTCDYPPCCNPRCLYEGDDAQNTKDKMERGRHRYRSHPGQSNGRAVISESNRVDIIRRWQAGERQIDLAKEYGIQQSAVSKIVTGRSWNHGV